MKTNVKRVVVLSALLAVAGCGKQEAPSGGQPGSAPPAAGPAGKEKEMGEALAKEVIEAFDQIVAEVAKALEGKPAQAEVLPKLEAIHQAWVPKMEALAARKAELVAAPAKGGFNAYMGEHRGKAMFRKDTALGVLVGHYRNFSPGPQVVEFVEKKLVGLMNIVHN